MKKIMKKILMIIAILMFATTTAQASEITGPLSTGAIKPTVPTGLTTSSPSQGDTEITINWNVVTSIGGYNLYRIKDGAPAVFVASTTSTSYTDTGLSDGNYSYQIDAYLGTLVSAKSVPTLPPVTIDTTTTTGSTGNTGNTSGGGGSSAPPIAPPTTAQADFNESGEIDILDFNILITNWGITTGATKGTGDADGNGTVDIFDFNILITNWS